MENNQFAQHVTAASQAIRRGGVILYPTDTIWGLGCDMTNESAVSRIYEIKQRPSDHPFLLIVDGVEMIKRYVDYIHPRIETLLNHHVQPLSLIYQANDQVPEYLTSGVGTVCIRIVKDAFCQALIKQIDQPLVSTSANVSGEDFPKAYEDISDRILDMVDHTVAPGCEGSPTLMPSIIAKYNHKGELEFLRE